MKKILTNWRYYALALLAAAAMGFLISDGEAVKIVIGTKVAFLVVMFLFFRLLDRWDKTGVIPELSKHLEE